MQVVVLQDIVIKDEQISKEGDGINLNLESSHSPCEDTNNSDPVAYLEIGGAKYQLRIVLAESDSDDQLCVGHGILRNYSHQHCFI